MFGRLTASQIASPSTNEALMLALYIKGIRRIVFVGLHVRLDELRRDELYCFAKLREFARPRPNREFSSDCICL